MTAILEQGGETFPLSAGHGGSRNPAPISASNLAPPRSSSVGIYTRHGLQPGFSLSQSELALNKRILRGLTYRDEPVGALVVQAKSPALGRLAPAALQAVAKAAVDQKEPLT